MPELEINYLLFTVYYCFLWIRPQITFLHGTESVELWSRFTRKETVRVFSLFSHGCFVGSVDLQYYTPAGISYPSGRWSNLTSKIS